MTLESECLGASFLGVDSTRFVVWAPNAARVDLHLVLQQEQLVPMQAQARGYFQAVVTGVKPGARYFYRLDGQADRPDPASRYQPEGVHGPSEVVDRFFDWTDTNWFGLPLQNYIIYELHVGTFTQAGTFDAIIPHLDGLVELGVTAIELLPLAQFPGTRNWGYDGVLPFAVQHSYGGPIGLQRLVDACHRRGLAVLLDVVYNHFGPEGNHFPEFGPYFTDRYRTPWGVAVNYDGPGSDEVRRFFTENAEMWVREFHIDTLRLDAVDNIFDYGAGTFLEELSYKFDQLEQHLPRKLYLMAEADFNNPRLVQPREAGGYGLDAQWTDDFHHALLTLLTGDTSSYYIDFKPDPGNPLRLVARALRDGYVYQGEFSGYRNHRRGVSSRGLPGYRHVVFAQNHDQVGNRMLGDRLNQRISPDAYKLAAGLIMLSPYIPLLFMGEEYAETAPFQYFVDHGDPALVEMVQKGRRDYFGGEHWQGEPPDPTAPETFQRSKLHHELAGQGRHAQVREFYRALIGLRKTLPALRELSKDNQEVTILSDSVLLLRRWYDGDQIFALFNFSPDVTPVRPALAAGQWQLQLDSAGARWSENVAAEGHQRLPETLESPGTPEIQLQPQSFVLYLRSRD